MAHRSEWFQAENRRGSRAGRSPRRQASGFEFADFTAGNDLMHGKIHFLALTGNPIFPAPSGHSNRRACKPINACPPSDRPFPSQPDLWSGAESGIVVRRLPAPIGAYGPRTPRRRQNRIELVRSAPLHCSAGDASLLRFGDSKVAGLVCGTISGGVSPQTPLCGAASQAAARCAV